MMHVSRSRRMRRELSGFGRFLRFCNESWSGSGRPLWSRSWEIHCSPLRFHFCGGIDPLLTIERHVSLNTIPIMIAKVPQKIVRNQKIDLQPRKCSSKPPCKKVSMFSITWSSTCLTITGPKAGPKVTPIDAYPMYFPLSALVAKSLTTALPSAIVPLLPELCMHLSTTRAA